MTDEELLGYLRRSSVGYTKPLRIAADRIEALVKRLDAVKDKAEAHIIDLMAERDRVEARAERLEAALKGLVEHCEVTRDTAGFWKPRQVHQLSPTQWQSWCKQIKSARAALKGDDHE